MTTTATPKVIFTCFLFTSLLFQSCKETTESPVNSGLAGIWQQIGYGRVVAIDEEVVIAYDINKVSCASALKVPIDYLPQFGEVIKQTRDSLTLKGGINEYDFVRLKELPQLCSTSEKDVNDPIYNFESLWHTFNEQYCYFETRGIDWNAYYETYRAKISENTEPLELFLLFEEMLESIGDGHIGMPTPEDLEESYEAHFEALEENEKNTPKTKIATLRSELRKDILNAYLDDYGEYHKGLVRWGTLKDHNMVYIQVNGMELFANYDISVELEHNAYFDNYYKLESENENAYLDNIAGTKFIMDSIVRAYTPDAYILDIRFNGGGTDEVGIEILEHFTAQKTKAFTKKARNGTGFTREIEVSLVPSDINFAESVYLLISGETASAAEIATLCGDVLPNVTLVGSNTEGVFSDILEKKLPNGWSFGLSNEIYISHDGYDYENKGVTPNVNVNYSRDTRDFYEAMTKDLEDGTDEAIEKVLSIFLSKTKQGD